MTNTVKFILLETDSAYNPTGEVLSKVINDVCIFEDGKIHDNSSDKEINYSDFLMVDNYDAAYTLCNAIWKAYNVSLCIAIWESDYPNDIDLSYKGHGKEKHEQVKANREAN